MVTSGGFVVEPVFGVDVVDELPDGVAAITGVFVLRPGTSGERDAVDQSVDEKQRDELQPEHDGVLFHVVGKTGWCARVSGVSLGAVCENVPAFHAGFTGDPVDFGVLAVEFFGLDLLAAVGGDDLVPWCGASGDGEGVPST